MPLESVLFLALVLVSLIVFGVALIYAEWTTRQVARHSAIAESSPAKASAHSQARAHVHEKAA